MKRRCLKAGVVVIEPGRYILRHCYRAAGRQARQRTIRLRSPEGPGTCKPAWQPCEGAAGWHGPGDDSPLIACRVNSDTGVFTFGVFTFGSDALEVVDHPFKGRPVQACVSLPAIARLHIQPPDIGAGVRHASDSSVVISLRVAVHV